MTKALSIYDLEPLDTGGIEARDGFALQDQVAASFCLELLVGEALREVWCESHDDITLIWHDTGIAVEFVQVKGSDLNQLWTIAKLCQRESKGKCVLERSLAHDRCCEPTRFRIVTSRPVSSELRILTLPIGSPRRNTDESAEAFRTMRDEMKPKVSEFKSPNGNDYMFWTTNTHWDVRHAETSVQNANVLALTKLLHDRDIFIAIDQVAELYARLLRMVWDASRADPRTAPESKRISRSSFEAWLTATTNEMSFPAGGATSKLREKMESAQLAADIIETACEQRRYYRHEVLSAKYMPLGDRPMVEGEIRAVLQHLRSRLDNGEMLDDGVAFHNLCLEELRKLREELSIKPKPPLAFMQGCMYSVTGRCLHRFRRVGT